MKLSVALIAIGAIALSTACVLPGTGNIGTLVTLSSADQNEIVAAHNIEKINTPVSVKDTKLYTWSNELAIIAQNLARRCKFSHSSSTCRSNVGGFASAGENLATGSLPSYSGMSGVKRMIQSWIDEKNDYNWGNNGCSGICGHYTQVVWADSYKVGCAVASCPNGATLPGFESVYLVCNYGPAGNYMGQFPAQRATGACASRPCGKCCTCKEVNGASQCECMPGATTSTTTCPTSGSSAPPPPPPVNPPPPPPTTSPVTSPVKPATPPVNPPVKPSTPPVTPPPPACDCKGRGTCTLRDSLGKLYCNCDQKYIGKFCETINPCFPSPCNRGTCSVVGNSYSCKCPAGFTGPNCATSTTPPPPPPAASVVASEVFKIFVKEAQNAYNAMDSILAAEAGRVAKSCGSVSAAGSATILLCGLDNANQATAQMYAPYIVNAWRSYTKFWTIAGRMSCVFDKTSNCGACQGGVNRPLTCSYSSPTAFVDHPMAWGLAGNGDIAHYSHKETSNSALLIGAAVAAVASVLVAAAVVYRRRRAAPENYSTMVEETL